MLKLTDQLYDFCPKCGQKLQSKFEDHQDRKFCPDHGMFFPHVAASACALIIRKSNHPFPNKNNFPLVSSSRLEEVARSAGGVLVGFEILLVKRNRQPYKDTWMCPAGYIEYGESPQEAIIREVKEETGLEVISSKIIDILQTTDDDRAPGHFAIFYKAQIKDSNLTNNYDQEENSQIAWFDLSKPLPEIGFKTHQEILRRLLAGEI